VNFAHNATIRKFSYASLPTTYDNRYHGKDMIIYATDCTIVKLYIDKTQTSTESFVNSESCI